MNNHFPSIIRVSVWTDGQKPLIRSSSADSKIGESLARRIHINKLETIGLGSSSYQWDHRLNDKEQEHGERYDRNARRNFTQYFYRRARGRGS
jgi:hypothetical protein